MNEHIEARVPAAEPFVLFGWGDDPDAQTITIIHDGAKPGALYCPTSLSPLQRRIMVLRLRYAADLIDPDKVWDL